MANGKRYFNIRTLEGVETFDEIDPADYKSRKEFRAALDELTKEHRMAARGVYVSHKSTKEWLYRK